MIVRLLHRKLSDLRTSCTRASYGPTNRVAIIYFKFARKKKSFYCQKVGNSQFTCSVQFFAKGLNQTLTFEKSFGNPTNHLPYGADLIQGGWGRNLPPEIVVGGRSRAFQGTGGGARATLPQLGGISAAPLVHFLISSSNCNLFFNTPLNFLKPFFSIE